MPGSDGVEVRFPHQMRHVLEHAGVRPNDLRELIAKSSIICVLDQLSGSLFCHVVQIGAFEKAVGRPDALLRPCAKPRLEILIPAHGYSRLKRHHRVLPGDTGGVGERTPFSRMLARSIGSIGSRFATISLSPAVVCPWSAPSVFPASSGADEREISA
jgi:hypothetical protein